VFAQLNSRAQSGFARLEVALSRTNWRAAKLLQELLFSSVRYLLYKLFRPRQTSKEKKDSQSPSLTHIHLRYWHNSEVPMKLVEMLSSVWTGKGGSRVIGPSR